MGLGYASEQELSPKPVQFSDTKNIIEFSGGGGHVIILLNTGKIYSCGWNHKGQLGIGTTTDQSNFQHIEISYPINRIFCGWDVSAAVTTNGTLLVWGCNTYFSLGENKYLTKPVLYELSNPELIIKVSFEFKYFNILSSSNNVYRIRKGHHFNNDCKLKDISLENSVIDISSGQNHTIFLTKNNRIIGIGDNKYNQIVNINLENTSISKLLSGWKHNGYLSDIGCVYLWGRNNYGQIGSQEFSETVKSPLQLNCDDKIIDFQLGSEHGICLSSNKNVYTWGWNEHGNCGNGNIENL